MTEEAERARDQPALKRGDTVTVHIVSKDGGPERRLAGMVKTLGNATGPLVVVVNASKEETPCRYHMPLFVHGCSRCAEATWPTEEGPLVVVADRRCANDDGAGPCGHPESVHGPLGCMPPEPKVCWCDEFVSPEDTDRCPD